VRVGTSDAATRKAKYDLLAALQAARLESETPRRANGLLSRYMTQTASSKIALLDAILPTILRQVFPPGGKLIPFAHHKAAIQTICALLMDMSSGTFLS
jgi:hypothetical protein